MNRPVYFVLSGFAAFLVVFASRAATAGGQSGALVRLQSSSPGTAQAGHINIGGRGLFSGSVGIGTTTPGAPLHVVGNNPFPQMIVAAGPSAPYGTFFSLDSTAIAGGKNWFIYSTGASAGEGPGKLCFVNYSDSTAALTLDSNGYIGMGTQFPTRPLDVTNTMGSGSSFDGGIIFQHTNRTQGIGFGYNTMYAAGTNGDQSLGLRSKGAGNIEINSSNGFIHGRGRAYFETGFGGAPTISLAVGDTDTGLNSAGDGNLDIYSNSAKAMSIRGGNIGIGISNPFARLDVVGDTAIQARGDSYGVLGFSDSGDGVGVEGRSANSTGVVGLSSSGNTSSDAGVLGISDYFQGNGVWGVANNGSFAYGVVGQSTDGYGLYAMGRTAATGTKSFRIDHPSDPLNKYLLHYCSEGPEVENFYNGNVTTDNKGEAWVQLPDYFGEINKDPRYTLTVVDDSAGPGFVQVKVARKIKDNRFMIMTSSPSVEVSWEVKAVRNDLWVQKHGAPVEVEKEGREKGKYQHPELYGAPPEMGIRYQRPTGKRK